MKDTIKIEMVYNEEHKYVKSTIFINNKEISFYTDALELLRYLNYTTPLQKTVATYKFHSWKQGHYQAYDWKDVYSRFYPFTCSCGESGCAGIWDGIYIKTRKHTVEWRIKDRIDNGYKFLDKSFYVFDKEQYTEEVMKMKAWMDEHKHLPIGDPYTEDGEDWDELLVEDLSSAYKPLELQD